MKIIENGVDNLSSVEHWRQINGKKNSERLGRALSHACWLSLARLTRVFWQAQYHL